MFRLLRLLLLVALCASCSTFDDRDLIKRTCVDFDCPEGMSCQNGFCFFDDPDTSEPFDVVDIEDIEPDVPPQEELCIDAEGKADICYGDDERCCPLPNGRGSRCVDISRSNEHCGGCKGDGGDSCDAEGLACIGGLCLCADSTKRDCAGTCVNISTNASHCNGCGFACEDTSDQCSSAQCQCGALSPCPEGWGCCGSVCVLLESDIEHCGACGVACVPGESCVGGQCTCDDQAGTSCTSPQVCCQSQCVPENDGLCQCGSQPSCDNDQICCSDTCISFQTDPNNCGDCGVVCTPPQSGCRSGSCECPAEAPTLCGGACFDLFTSQQHCGGCDRACMDGLSCISGKCTCPQFRVASVLTSVTFQNAQLDATLTCDIARDEGVVLHRSFRAVSSPNTTSSSEAQLTSTFDFSGAPLIAGEELEITFLSTIESIPGELDSLALEPYVFRARAPSGAGTHKLVRGDQLLDTSGMHGSVLADLDGDGDLDYVYVVSTDGGRMERWTFEGDQFQLDKTWTEDLSDPRAVAAGDLDGDGVLELVVAQRPNSAAGRVFTETTSVVIADGLKSRDVALGDINGDGKLDVVFASEGTDRGLYLNASTAPGEFAFVEQRVFTQNGKREVVALGDLDQDGDLDVVFAVSGRASQVWLNDGFDGTVMRFRLGAQIAHGLGARDVDLGDVDRDGDLDIAFAGNSDVDLLYLNDGLTEEGIAFSSTSPKVDSTLSVLLVDLDGDDDLELVLGANSGKRSRIYANPYTGSGVWPGHNQAFLLSRDPDNHDIVCGDIDKDNDVDCIVLDSGTDTRVWWNPGPP